jgi:protein phosphatase
MLVRGIESFVLTALIPLLNSHNVARDAVAAGFHTALRKIENLLLDEANRNLDRRGMGTTATVALTLNSHLIVSHVGDGRCYILRDGKLQRLTRDHTLVQTMLDQGLISPDQAAHHRFQHVLTNSVGGSSRGVVAESHRSRLRAGDTLLLCTDGLTRMVAEDQILETLQAEPDPWTACQCLVDLANAAGGRDNITVIVAQYEAAAVHT